MHFKCATDTTCCQPVEGTARDTSARCTSLLKIDILHAANMSVSRLAKRRNSYWYFVTTYRRLNGGVLICQGMGKCSCCEVAPLYTFEGQWHHFPLSTLCEAKYPEVGSAARCSGLSQAFQATLVINALALRVLRWGLRFWLTSTYPHVTLNSALQTTLRSSTSLCCREGVRNHREAYAFW